MSDPFGYGYAVSHSEPSALIPLIGYIFSYMIWVMVLIPLDMLYFFIYDMGYGSDTTDRLYIFHIGYGYSH